MSNQQNEEEITDEELESLQTPVPRVQEAEWKRILGQINEHSIGKLLDLAGFKLIDWQFHAQSKGVINKIFFIRAHRESDTSQIVELVLRLNNPHPFWIGKRNRTEVGIMNFIKKSSAKDKIPVATIYSYSSDPKTSVIGCDYILMEKLPGEILENLITDDIYDLPDRLFDEIIGIVKEIKHLKEFDPKLIAAFDENMNLTDLTLDGPSIKKSSTFLDFLNQQFDFSVKEIKKFKKYTWLANRLEKFQADLNEFTKSNPKTNELNFFGDTMAIQHGDLNASNILVDPETYKITGILDWDFCKHTFDDKSFGFLDWWCNEANREKMSERMNSFREKHSERKQMGEELRHKLYFIAETANQLGFYVTSWFKSDDFVAEAKQHINHHAKMVENLLNEFKFEDYIF